MPHTPEAEGRRAEGAAPDGKVGAVSAGLHVRRGESLAGRTVGSAVCLLARLAHPRSGSLCTGAVGITTCSSWLL